MALDEFKSKGELKANKPNAGGGATLEYPVIGIVKDNIDPTRSGKIRVQIEGNTNNQSDTGDGWTTVQYLSTYFGMVKPTAGQSGNGDYVGNPSAYGQWQSPPDIGTQVLCIFANGDPSRGYYIGAVVDPEALQMIPAIGSSENVVPNEGEAQGLAGAPRLPVTSINTNNRAQADSTNYLDAPKPVHSYTASIMSQQGIIRDPIRGPISSSASREAVSRVGWGVATPGRPIMEGGYNDENLPENLSSKNQEQLKVTARRGGHSIVMDDGDIIGRDQLIRIRTALGHQIMMSDDGQTLMILHSNGQSYVELGKEGTVDIFSTNSFNVRTQGDINFHADQHINFHASENMNIQAKNLHINTEEDFKMRSGQNLQLYSVSDFTVKSLGAASIKADGQASLASSGTTFINGSKVNLNTGKSSVSPKKVPIITLISQADTLHDEQKGFIAAPGKLLSVTTRTPAHYPWTAAGQGVDVKSTLDAVKSLPVTPSSGVQKANQEGLASGATPPAIATVASAPDTKPISKSVDKTVTNAVMGSVATSAATGETKKAVTAGAAIVSTSTSSSSSSTTTTTVDGTTTTTSSSRSSSSTKVVAVGTYAQSPTQLVNAGVLKPGADRLINGLAQRAGATAESVMPKNLFTGKPGAVDLQSFVSDVTSQTKAVITTVQKAQTALGVVGMLTGKEAATQSAGMVLAAATVGLGPTVNAVKNISGVATTAVNNISGQVSGAVNSLAAGVTSQVNNLASQATNIANQATGAINQASSALKAIGAGTAAAGLANKLGGLGGISNSLKGLSKGLGGLKGLGGKLGGLFGGGGGDGPSFTDLVESVKGPAGAAFTTIRDSLKPLQAGVPQNLGAIAKASAATIAGISSSSSGNPGVGEDFLKSFIAGAGITSITDINELIDNNTVAGITGAFKQVKTQINAMGDDLAGESANVLNQFGTAITNNLATGIGNDIVSQFGGNAVATLTSLSKALTNTPRLIDGVPDNLGSIVNPMNVLNNIFNDINTDITGVAGAISLIPNNVEQAIEDISSAVKDVNGILGAAQAITKGDMTELSNAASAVQSGASAALSSAIASGINNLPGGAKAISAVMNNAEGAINSLPGTEMLGDLVKNLQTSALNEVSKSVNGITNSINSKLGGVLSKEGGLTNLISSALPLGKASALLSGLSALGAGGPAKIKLPTISFNTFDRLGLDNQVKTLLSNPKIPIPNLIGEIKAGVVSKVEQLIKQNKDAFKVFDDLKNWDAQIKAATDSLYKLESDLPAGDPGIAAARGVVDSLLNSSEYTALLKKIENFGESAEQDVRSLITNAGTTATNMLKTSSFGTAVSTIKSSAMQVMQQTNVGTQSTAIKTVRGQGATAVTMLQSKKSASEQELNNSIAGIIGPGTTFI
jgi:uncharacterized protein YoxC